MNAEIQMYKINTDMFNTSSLKQTVNRYINSGLWKHLNGKLMCLFVGNILNCEVIIIFSTTTKYITVGI